MPRGCGAGGGVWGPGDSQGSTTCPWETDEGLAEGGGWGCRGTRRGLLGRDRLDMGQREGRGHGVERKFLLTWGGGGWPQRALHKPGASAWPSAPQKCSLGPRPGLRTCILRDPDGLELWGGPAQRQSWSTPGFHPAPPLPPWTGGFVTQGHQAPSAGGGRCSWPLVGQGPGAAQSSSVLRPGSQKCRR